MAGACAAAIRIADRSLPEPYVVSLARACTQVAVFGAQHLRHPEEKAPLPRCRKEAWTFNKKKRRRDACVCRIGVHAWSPSYRGLGVEIATASQVAVAGVGEAGDQATLNCVGRLWCPLRPEVLGDELDELDAIQFTRCWYEFWTDSVDEIEDTSTIAPPKRLKRSTAIGAQTVGWGESPMRCLGRDLGAVASRPQPLFIRDLEALERIKTVACSARHTVVLTWRGRVFCCGDNEDGACGVGGTQKVSRLAAVSWPDDAPIQCTKIAAGADVFGASSCAVSSEGTLYCWGSGVACACRATAPRLTPTAVSFSDEDIRVVSIAAGGSFCVALDEQKRLWSWGMYASGRLGLGQPPKIRDPRIREGDVERPGRSARLQLAPKLIEKVVPCRHDRITYYDADEAQTVDAPMWSSVVCGEAHALATDEHGRLYAFGSNAHGQLGLGVAKNGGTQDAFLPTPVVPFFTSQKVVHASAGPTHSAVIDEKGRAWTWGGGGHGLALLGHGARKADAPPLMSTTDWMARRVTERRRPSSQKSARGAFRATRTLVELRFAWPRRVHGLDGLQISQIACGERHTAFLTQDGSLYTCGDGLALLGADETTERARKVGEVVRDEEALLQAAVEASVVDVPRQPNAAWLPALDGKRVERVSCGGQHTVALVSGSQAAHLLGAKLWKAARKATQELNGEPTSDGEEDALVDCLLVPGGGDPIYAHLAVLAARSPMLEELIMLEKREDGDDDGYLQILVPDLSPRVCELFLEYCYRDDIFEPRDQPLPLPLIAELKKGAELYKTPRLASLCAQALGNVQIDEAYDDVLPSTLADDFEALVNKGDFTDVTVKASKGQVKAHRPVLAARSDYFRAMFRSGMRESIDDGFQSKQRQKVEVCVPDDDDDVSRLFRAVYSSKLPLGDGDRFLRDVVAADRYGLEDVRRLGEAGCATSDSADRSVVLATASRIGAANLYSDQLGKACTDIADLNLKDLGTDVLEDLMTTIASQRPHLLRPAAPPEPPYDPDKVISTPIAAGNLSWKHSVAMSLAAMVTFVAQSAYRFRQTASMVINGVFLVFVLWLYRDSARREAARIRKKGS